MMGKEVVTPILDSPCPPAADSYARLGGNRMAGQTDTSQLNWPRWAQALLIALLALVIGVRMIMLADTIVRESRPGSEVGTFGGMFYTDPTAEAGYGQVVNLEPDGPLAKAGVREGDRVRFDRPYQRHIARAVGEKLSFTLDRSGVRSNRQLTVAPRKSGDSEQSAIFWRLLNFIGAMISLLIGSVILWRGWGNKAAMLLGGAVTALHLGRVMLPPWASAPELAAAMWTAYLAGALLVMLLPAFAMRLYEESVGNLPRWQWRVLACFLALSAILAPFIIWCNFTLTAFPIWRDGLSVGYAFQVIAHLACIAYLIAGWRDSSGAVRNRYAMLIFALTVYLLAALAMIFLVQGRVLIMESTPHSLLSALVQGLIAPGLLAYAVLRHKLFDLGFAVNRTLVYGTVSALLLATIGLLEYGAKALVPKIWMQGSVLISAGIAVGLYLVFHRIHGAVEHVVERLFFHKWQLNEAALRRFVRAAAHVEKPEALVGNFAAELARFSGGASVAIYARGPGGAYASEAGGAIDADDPALAAMRAEQEAVVPAELGSPLSAALALPMMHQAALAGFVLLGPKPSGEDYRPDEIEVLAWAAQQVGLDLQAIRVRDLELSNVRLAERNQVLTELLTTKQAPA